MALHSIGKDRHLIRKASTILSNAEGKLPVRKKGEDRVSRVSGGSALSTSHPVASGSYFTVGRKFDIVVEGHGRVKIDEIVVIR